ncbi:hypothetical protein SHI21_20070 [Bacteriovorax sp. PP10]|uniref:Long-chain fatty acid transport protein n=1 Tax=Bacteriovorax antarcticus TaxID=3088717 RepID=A0ABU5W1Y8_9BACT|nr:hypothetical protein [Bacteriovorax sp. PP10]MEA9358544.1 hypothetical protein [Bacteriovorax sp. PP10]
MYKILSGVLVLSLSAPLMAAGVHRGGAELLNPSAYAINANASMFQTSAFYDTDGVETELVDGNKYRLIDMDLAVSYGVSKSLEITAMGRFRQVSSTVNEITKENSGPESLGVEAKYAFETMGNLRYAVGIHYRQTLYTNASYENATLVPEDEIILGDSGSEYGVDLYTTYISAPWKFDARIGYSSPANNLSDEVTYKLEGMYRFSKLGLLAGVEGIYSLKKDEFSETPALKAVQATGGTALFNSINREKVAPYLGFNYAFDKFIMAVKGQTVMSGTSTDKGNTISLNIGWSSDGVTPESVKVDSFKEYQVDGSVLKISARSNFIRIDQGLSTDVEKGMKFDIYQTDYFGGNVLVASGIVYEVGADWSIIKLVKKYKDIEIKPGFAARGY